MTSPDDGVTYQASAGAWHADTLRLQPDEARQFTITMTEAVSAEPPSITTTPAQSETQSSETQHP